MLQSPNKQEVINMKQEVRFQHISATTVTEGNSNNLHLFALDKDGHLWQWMRGTWDMMKHPHKEVPEPRFRAL